MRRSLHRHRAKALPHDHLPLQLGLRWQVRISLTALAGTRSLSLIRARARARHIQVQSLPFTCILPQSHQLLVTHRLQITDAVHEQKSFIFAQLWALGRTANPDALKAEGFELVGPSDIPAAGKTKPRPLTTDGV